KSNLIPHPAPQLAEILLRQLLEMQFRALIDLEVERIDLSDDRRYVIDDAHLDWGSLFRRPKLLAQLSAGRAVERAVHIVVEACVIDAEPGHRQTRDASESVVEKTVECGSVACRKFLEHDQLCSERTGMTRNQRGQQLRVSAVVGLIAVKMPFASGAPNHQGARPHEARPHITNATDKRTKSWAHPNQQVLIK